MTLDRPSCKCWCFLWVVRAAMYQRTDRVSSAATATSASKYYARRGTRTVEIPNEGRVATFPVSHISEQQKYLPSTVLDIEQLLSDSDGSPVGSNMAQVPTRVAVCRSSVPTISYQQSYEPQIAVDLRRSIWEPDNTPSSLPKQSVVKPVAVKALPTSPRFHPLMSSPQRVQSSVGIPSSAHQSMSPLSVFHSASNKETVDSLKTTNFVSGSSPTAIHNCSLSETRSREMWHPYLSVGQTRSGTQSIQYRTAAGELGVASGAARNVPFCRQTLPFFPPESAHRLPDSSWSTECCSPEHFYQPHNFTSPKHVSSSVVKSSLPCESPQPALPRDVLTASVTPPQNRHTKQEFAGIASPAKSFFQDYSCPPDSCSPMLQYRLQSPSAADSSFHSSVMSASRQMTPCRGPEPPVKTVGNHMLMKTESQKHVNVIRHGTNYPPKAGESPLSKLNRMQVPTMSVSSLQSYRAPLLTILGGPEPSSSHGVGTKAGCLTSSHKSGSGSWSLPMKDRVTSVLPPATGTTTFVRGGDQVNWNTFGGLKQPIENQSKHVIPPRQSQNRYVRPFSLSYLVSFKQAAMPKSLPPRVGRTADNPLPTNVTTVSPSAKFFVHGSADFDTFIEKSIDVSQNRSVSKPGLCSAKQSESSKPSDVDAMGKPIHVSQSQAALKTSVCSSKSSELGKVVPPTKKVRSPSAAGVKRKLDLTPPSRNAHSAPKQFGAFENKFQESVSRQGLLGDADGESQAKDLANLSSVFKESAVCFIIRSS